MRQVEIEYVTGSSQAGLSGRAVATSMLFGSKKGGNQVANWFTGNTKRQYKRKKQVWECRRNCGNHTTYQPSTKTISTKPTKADKIEQKAIDIERKNAAEARIKELEYEANYTLFEKLIHYTWSAIKISFWLFVALIGLIIMFR